MRRRLTLRQVDALKGYFFISPWIIGAALFTLGPLVYSLYLSFRELALEGVQFQYVGLRNYSEAIFLDERFLPILLGSLGKNLVEIPIVISFSLAAALLVSRRQLRGAGFFKVILFLPVVIASGMIVNELATQGAGEFSAVRSIHLASNTTLERYLGPALSESVSEIFGRLTFVLWRTGVQILIFTAGLQGISQSMYEAARVDGASEWENLWLITLPMLTPIILLNTVYTVVDSFTDVFNEVLTYIQTVAFNHFRMGYAAALGWMYFILVFLLVGLVFLLMRNRLYYAGEK